MRAAQNKPGQRVAEAPAIREKKTLSTCKKISRSGGYDPLALAFSIYNKQQANIIVCNCRSSVSAIKLGSYVLPLSPRGVPESV
jgi:hypothetical protein